MGLFDAFKSDHDEVHSKGNLTHDALAGAVAYEAFKAYEDHCTKNGKPDSHAKAKELVAAAAAAALTHLGETKGKDWLDARRRKAVEEQAETTISEKFTEEVYTNYEE